MSHQSGCACTECVMEGFGPTYTSSPPLPSDMSTSPLPWRAGVEGEEPEIIAANDEGVVFPGDIGGFAREGDRQLVITAVNKYDDLIAAYRLARNEITRLREELYKLREGK